MYTSRERQYTALINIFRALGHALIGSGWVPAFEKTKKNKTFMALLGRRGRGENS